MNCLNCDTHLEQIKGKREKQFCNSTCRSNYWQKEKRKKDKEKPPEKIILRDFTKPSKVIKPITQKPAKTNHVINTTTKNIPPMPERKQGEDAFDFAARKNEWKRLYQK